jgi:hypothetical protein
MINGEERRRDGIDPADDRVADDAHQSEPQLHCRALEPGSKIAMRTGNWQVDGPDREQMTRPPGGGGPS